MPPLRSTGVGREAENPEYAGEYRLGACLGAGGMGVVHLARSASGLRLAIKIVHETHASDPEFRARFRQEVAAARRVSGAFTAPVVDADPEAERPWMATLYVPGPTLAEQVKRSGPLSPAELRRLTAGLAEALRDIHRAGVVHRDLKPGNVLLTDSGPKVIDFGISRPSDSDVRTETGKLIGSPPFMAPEQFQRPREVGPAADVFALGSVLVHAATGTGPFDSDSPYIVAYQVVHDEADLTGVPEELAPLVARCLAKEPSDRPTPDEIMAALKPPSYEAAAFIPAQRRPSAAPVPDLETRTLGKRESGGDTTEAVGAGQPTRALRIRRWPLAVVAAFVVTALAAGGAVLARQDGDSVPETRRQPTAAQSAVGWQTHLRAQGDAAPSCAASDGGLICTARGIGAARLDAATGKVAWSRPARVEDVGPARVPVGGHVVTLTGNRLTTFDARTGRPGWSADATGYFADAVPCGDVLLLGSASGTVTGLDGATGKPLWRHPLRGHSAPRLGPYDAATGLVHLFEESAGGRTLITSVRARTGEVVHQRRLAGELTPAALGEDGTVVLTSRGAGSQVDAVVRYDPALRTSNRVRLPSLLENPGVAVRGSVVYLLDRVGTLVAVDTAAEGGRDLWQLETAAGQVSAPVIGPDGRLYLSAADGRLVAVDTGRGALLGQTKPRLPGGRLRYASALSAPVVLGPLVVATAPDGSVFAVGAADPAAW
ncbi:serine/threonine-protein kinase [Streptomyces sp. NPDC048629]|uniref:serine/threonine-protein kinase n=1 Tax=Streptomyces sp. NPDC048629 TaxID=3154824 RepID=UPI00342385AD